MTLTVSCKSCRQIIRFNERVTDRVELAKKRTENLEIECQKCGHIDKYHVDDIMADSNRIVSIINLTILIIGTPLIAYLIWTNLGGVRLFELRLLAVGLFGVILIPFLIFLTITKSQQEKQRLFNRYKLKA